MDIYRYRCGHMRALRYAFVSNFFLPCGMLLLYLCVWSVQSAMAYVHPFSPNNESSFTAAFEALCGSGNEHRVILPVTLMVYGHKLRVPRTLLGLGAEPPLEDGQPHPQADFHHHRRAAMFHFDDLCGAKGCAAVPLGPSDYILLAATFSHVFISHVPKMTLNDLNEVRSFDMFLYCGDGDGIDGGAAASFHYSY
jgi:predicted ATPase